MSAVAELLPCGCHKVTRDGVVYSCLDQMAKAGHSGILTIKTAAWKRLNGTKTRKGYWQVALHGRSVRVNRLVAEYFLPNPFGYPESQHRDGNKDDNSVANLKWGNQLDNAADRAEHGHTVRGENSPNAKLSANDARTVLSLRTDGFTIEAIARRFDVSKKLILLIIQRKIWRHI